MLSIIVQALINVLVIFLTFFNFKMKKKLLGKLISNLTKYMVLLIFPV